MFEKNDRPGRKLFITGKGRCNLTNACDTEELFDAVLSNSSFLYSSFYGCTNQDVIQFFEELGLKLKVERGNRVFPASDHSSDVIRVLTEEKDLRCRRQTAGGFSGTAASLPQEAFPILLPALQETDTGGPRPWGIR